MYMDTYAGWSLPVTFGYSGGDYTNKWYNATPLGLAFKSILGIPDSLALSGGASWPKAFICPKATLSLSTTLGSSPTLYNVTYSYGENASNWANWGADDFRGAKSSQIANPSAKLQFGDGTDWQLMKDMSYYASKYAMVGEFHDNSTYSGMTAYRHNLGANFTFYDGHSANMKYQIIQGSVDYWMLW